MNPELQKSFQMTMLSQSLDGYLLIVLLIMVLTGLLGGVANYYLNERHAERGRRDIGKYLTLGVIAALTVPLFLNMISSNLLEAARTRPVDFFVFAGFCLIYVVFSRRAFENVANPLFGQMDQMKREMAQIKEQHESLQGSAIAREEPAMDAAAGAPSRNGEPGKDVLAYNDIEILRALAEEIYVFGNLAGLTEKTGLARELISNRLTVLKNQGLIETRINDKGVLHWCVSPKGKQTLGEILSGQEER